MDEDSNRVSKKVIIEQVGESTSRNNAPVMIIVAILVIALVGYILINMR